MTCERNVSENTEYSERELLGRYYILRGAGIRNIGSDYFTLRAFAFAMIVAETGMSPDEVRNLMTENIDSGIWVNMISLRTRDVGDGAALSVTMGCEGSRILSAYIDSEDVPPGSCYENSALLFPSEITDDGIMSRWEIKKMEEKVSKACGMEINFESLRRTFG
ncbi:MAG: hypothetical protein ACOX8L_01615 [Candidatus Methanomethylophilaceae archaeon]|jgi:integrase